MFMWNLSFHAGTTALWRTTSKIRFPQSSEGSVTLEELEKRLLKSHSMLKSGSTEAQPNQIQQPGLCTLISKSYMCKHLWSGFSFDVDWHRPMSIHRAFSSSWVSSAISGKHRVPFRAVVCCHVAHSRAGLGREHTLTWRQAHAWGCPQIWSWGLERGLSSSNFRKQCLVCKEAAKLDIHFLRAAGVRKLRDALQ